MREIKDYLKYYIGCQVEFGYDGHKKRGELVGNDVRFGWQIFSPSSVMVPYQFCRADLIKPILRRLSSMTQEECNECGNMDYDFSDHPDKRMREHHWEQFDLLLSANQFHYLLSKGFDLFHLIDEGLAIESTPSTINK